MLTSRQRALDHLEDAMLEKNGGKTEAWDYEASKAILTQFNLADFHVKKTQRSLSEEKPKISIKLCF
ncbi:MAG: hypothetical protein IPP53_15650 [Bacteroidetes bacterium]|nr:hypothetical protein [Bacteroidota bacterium]